MTRSDRCAACKYFRRMCPSDCIFAPYFPSDNPQRFACLHKIFRARNVEKMLRKLPPNVRAQAVDSMYFEAQCRVQFPVYGCAGIISQLHQDIQIAETELAKAKAKAEIAIINFNNGQENQFHHQLLEVEANLNNILQLQNNVELYHFAIPSTQPPNQLI